MLKIEFDTKNVKKRIIDLDMNIGEFCNYLEIRPSNFSCWCNNTVKPRWRYIEKMCELLDCRLDDLFIIKRIEEKQVKKDGTFEELMNEYEHK